jgi:hypothetical protein
MGIMNSASLHADGLSITENVMHLQNFIGPQYGKTYKVFTDNTYINY